MSEIKFPFGSELARAIAAVKPAMLPKKEGRYRPILYSILIEVAKNRVRFVSANNHVLAIHEADLPEPPAGEFRWVLAGESLPLIRALLAESRDMPVALSDEVDADDPLRLRLQSLGGAVEFRQRSGAYPRYTDVTDGYEKLPQEGPTVNLNPQLLSILGAIEDPVALRLFGPLHPIQIKNRSVNVYIMPVRVVK